jgi:hypothetical protein
MSEKDFPLIFAFYHLYKCGGSTFNQILECNFPRAVLYAETHDHLQSGQALGRRRKRLEMQPVENYLNVNSHFRALSSHFASPDIASFALQPVTIVRDPYSRIVSAFSFDKALKNIRHDVTFDEYLSNNVNRMTSLLYAGQQASEPFFYGVLEMFDESMILLERKMYLDHGVQVDLSYARPLNKASAHGKEMSHASQASGFKSENADDYELYNSSLEFIISSITRIQNWDSLVCDYTRRKANRIWQKEAGLLDMCVSGNNPKLCTLF